jgi:predicted molibdopterin-dependent oxidoreductase YjgC
MIPAFVTRMENAPASRTGPWSLISRVANATEQKLDVASTTAIMIEVSQRLVGFDESAFEIARLMHTLSAEQFGISTLRPVRHVRNTG